MNAPPDTASAAIDAVRQITAGTNFEGRLYLVGGLLRDRLLGMPQPEDLDLMVEGDALALAVFLHEQGLSTHYPVLYPRFGTAMIHVPVTGGERTVELVSARAEKYREDSRKPEVSRGTLHDDVFRRDFTINTLMENLHSGELLDITGRAIEDLRAGIIRTPLEPEVTFFDDPLRMLRAIRFASRFGFTIEEGTKAALIREAGRLRPPAIAFERIREEFTKIVSLPGRSARAGIEMLRDTGLLAQFMPEMEAMAGCTQGSWHLYDVFTHTMTAMEALPDDAPLRIRLGLLWHDIGKPATRTEDERGVHFYGHQAVGARIASAIMTRLKFSNEDNAEVEALVAKHMRLGDYRAEWPDATVKRLIRDCGAQLDDLFTLVRCDIAASCIPDADRVDLEGLRARIDHLNALSNVRQIVSPLDGRQIMEALEIGSGPHLRDAKEYLVNEVIEGRLAEGDEESARDLIRVWWLNRTSE